MPVLESIDKISPRSALRHRPIVDDAGKSGKEQAAPNTGTTPVVQRASRFRPRQTDDVEDIDEWQRTGTDDSMRDRMSAAPRKIGIASKKLPKVPGPKAIRSKRKFWHGAHPLLYLGVGMIAMLTLWTLLSMAVGWWNTTWDDIHYGRPRTFQIDALVGHNEAGSTPSHFIAINLNGRIEVIELPGGDGSKARIYLGPQLYGASDDLIPVTLSFVDVNGDHLPDMIIHFQTSRIVFINDQGGFRPLRPEERYPVEKFLQHIGQ
jgi:hypothetical protein